MAKKVQVFKKLRIFQRGEYLFHEGDKSDCLLLIQKGTISIRKRKGGGAVELSRIHMNEVLGELAFFDKKPRSASAVAITEVEVLEISYKDLEGIYKKIPSYLKAIMSAVAERLRKADRIIQRLDRHLISEEKRDSKAGKDSASKALEITSDVGVIVDMPLKGKNEEADEKKEDTPTSESSDEKPKQDVS